MTPRYDLRREDSDLIAAALALGKGLGVLETAARKQRKAIDRMLAFLGNLPAPPPAGFEGEFGFRFEFATGNENRGHLGSWCVSVYDGMFEIFGCGREGLTEFSWLLWPGQRNYNDLSCAADWINQVSDPMALISSSERFVLVASASTSFPVAAPESDP